MAKSIPTAQTAANIARVCALLAEVPVRLTGLSVGRSEEELRQPRAMGERSFAEMLAHLLNCEARTADAIYLALLLEMPLLHALHPERQIGPLLRFDQCECGELLRYFATRRRILLDVLQALDDVQWARTTREEGKQRHESVYRWARSLALHEDEHLLEFEAAG
jgi:hypothetical protein